MRKGKFNTELPYSRAREKRIFVTFRKGFSPDSRFGSHPMHASTVDEVAVTLDAPRRRTSVFNYADVMLASDVAAPIDDLME